MIDYQMWSSYDQQPGAGAGGKCQGLVHGSALAAGAPEP